MKKYQFRLWHLMVLVMLCAIYLNLLKSCNVKWGSTWECLSFCSLHAVVALIIAIFSIKYEQRSKTSR